MAATFAPGCGECGHRGSAGEADRVNDYTGNYPLSAINSCSSSKDMGAQVSFR